MAALALPVSPAWELHRAGEAQPRRWSRRKRLESGEKSEEGERISTG